jgi:hypothetical protein
LFDFVFSLGCVHLYSRSPCTFDGWVSILDFDLQGFFSFSMHNGLVSAHKTGEGFLGPRLRFRISTRAFNLPFTLDVDPLFMFLPFSSGLVLFL